MFSDSKYPPSLVYATRQEIIFCKNLQSCGQPGSVNIAAQVTRARAFDYNFGNSTICWVSGERLHRKVV